MDVGREGHVADAIQDSEEIWAGVEAQGTLTEVGSGLDCCCEQGFCVAFEAEEECFARLNFTTGADERCPGMRAGLLGEQDLDFTGWAG